MAYIIFFVFVGITGYVGWKNKAQVIAFFQKLQKPKAGEVKPNSGATVPNSDTAANSAAQNPTPQPGTATTVAGTSIPSNGILDAYLRNGSGNATPGYTPGNFDVRSLISDSSVLDASTKFRAPPGVKTFSCPVKPGNYFIDGAECWGGLTIVVKHADGTVIGKDAGGLPQVAWKQDAEETLIVETNYAGTNTDAGIKLHPSA